MDQFYNKTYSVRFFNFLHRFHLTIFYLLEILHKKLIVIEVVHTVHPLPSYGDDIKHQAIHLPVLHHSEDLQLTQDAGGGHGDVLEDNEDLKALVFSCPRQARAECLQGTAGW